MTRSLEELQEFSKPASVGPSPGNLALELSVECRLSRDSPRGKKHLVTIHPDWSVSTPHDLDAERIAVALGGFTSCLALVDRTIPAFRSALPLLARFSRVSLRRDKSGGWRLPLGDQIENCCSRHQFATIGSAVSHLRSVKHLARAHHAPEWQLAKVMSGAERAWGPWEKVPPSGSQFDGLVGESGGVAELWKAGIRPDELERFAAAAQSVHGSLPVSYFLGMAYNDADPDWLRDTVTHRPDANTAAWLAWLDPHITVDNGQEWGAWLELGLSRDEVRAAVSSGLRADDVRVVAHETRRSISAVARSVVAWARAGCFPTASQLQILARRGVDYADPSPAAIDALVIDANNRKLIAASESTVARRTELALMLMVLGTRRAVVDALANGVHSVEDLDSFIY